MNWHRIVLYDLLFLSLGGLVTVVSLFSYQRIKNVSQKAAQTNVAYNSSLQLNVLFANLANIESAQQRFPLHWQTSPIQSFDTSQKRIQQSLKKLRQLTQQDIEKTQQVSRLDSLFQIRFKLLQNRYDPRYAPASGTIDLSLLPTEEAVTNGIYANINQMFIAENDILSGAVTKTDSPVNKPSFPLLLGMLGISFVAVAYVKVRKEIHLRHDAEKAASSYRQQQLLAKEMESRLLNLADAVPVLIWLCDTEGSFYFFNRQWLLFTKRTAEEEKNHGWLKSVHPAEVEIFRQGFAEAFKKRSDFLLELRLKKKDQQYRWLALRAIPMFEANGNFIGYAGGCMDIEKQKNFARDLEEKVAERTLELKELNDVLKIRNTVFAHAEATAFIGSYSWHFDTGKLDFSDNFFRLLGYEPQEFDPSFEKFASMIHPDDKEQVLVNIKNTALSKILFEDIYRIYTKQGAIRYFKSSGNFVGSHKELLVGTAQDVTKDMLMKERLTEQNLELERNNTELRSFTYVASHDLQEPLRKIQSFSRLIIQTEIESLSLRGKGFFERIDRAAGRMQNLIESLLNYSRVNHAAINFVQTDLNVLLAEIKTDLGELIDEKKATIEHGLLPTVPVMPSQFYQLFSNIIINAIKYSKQAARPRIIIHVENVCGGQVPATNIATKKKFWKISFSDNGIGFNAEYEEKVFELFQRLHGSSEYEGTGIGLAICRKIVNNHNGFITAEGIPGTGATFTIYIPDVSYQCDPGGSS